MLLLSMLFFFYGISFSQHPILKRSHLLTISNSLQPQIPDTLTLLVVRVEFQADENRFTTGDGTFDPENLTYLDKPEVKIDPLPHDLSYFESHLLFAKNYFEKVSGNQIAIKYRILPNVYRLPEKMEAYSPTGERFTNERVARLAQDTWETVESLGGFPVDDLDPKKTAFVIFHAGVGRDIELTKTTLDKTPQDIPSLSLGQGTLSQLLGRPNFDGFDINNGAFKVTNSLVLPRTLSRRGEDVAGEEFVLQLSINGLLCASIGNYLGLPDLFDTGTGKSGIGRFGLIDGESFFSYRGLFPPEPSAWEKIFLGWQSPFQISTNTGNPISLPASSFHQSRSIAQFRLSDSEYFLVENRHRDPNHGGVKITFRQPDGTTQTKRFNNLDEAFVNQTEEFTDDLIKGVVIDVSNFDWSLPGRLDHGLDKIVGTADDRLLNGGILIWHIDEAVIQRNLASQTVNADPGRRGVDLEEADGAQDIGRAANETLDTQARGTPFDFWWNGNDASVITLGGDTLSFYENRFGPDTRPSNASNSGAPSFFELYDFSDNRPVATFRIRPKSAQNIQTLSLPLNTLPDQTTFTSDQNDYFSAYPLSLSLFKTNADSFLIIPSQQTTYALNLGNSSDPLFDFQSGQAQQPYGGSSLILGETPLNDNIDIWAWQWRGTNWSQVWNRSSRANSAFLSSIDDQTLLVDFTDQRINISDGSFLPPLPNPQQRSTSLGNLFTSLSANVLTLQPQNRTFAALESGNRQYTGAVRLTENETGFYLLTASELLIFNPDTFEEPTTVITNTRIDWPAFTDINDDGKVDFIYVNQTSGALEARNVNGAMLSHFPILPPRGTQFTGTPLITSSEDLNKKILLIVSQDSLSMNIRAYKSDGEQVEGFPLFVGSISESDNQPIHPFIHGNTLYAVSHKGELNAWQLNSIGEVLWGSRYGNSSLNKVTGNPNFSNAPPLSPDAILTKSETYNWPNPADGFTNLRYQTSGNGTVDIKIITPAGKVVFEKQYEAAGSVPEEQRISTQNWNNGLYIALVTATVNGKKARKILKIVVVH